MLPPLFRAIALRERGDAFAHAIAIAATEGAGTLVWVRRFDTIEVAVVLEPEAPLAQARRALYAGMNALVDALASYAPPERPIAIAWPDTVLLDGAMVGGGRLAAPADCAEDAVPDWLVISCMLRSVVALKPKPASGPHHPLDQMTVRGTSLEGEGFEMLDAGAVIASFARHLMLHLNQWSEDGFDPIAKAYLARLSPEPAAFTRRGLDGNGDLLIRALKPPQSTARDGLAAALARPQWLDPDTGEPWL